jgi:hypothetical protein
MPIVEALKPPVKEFADKVLKYSSVERRWEEETRLDETAV